MRDFNGRDIKVVESPDDVIKVWEISTAPSGEYDCIVIREWQEMLEFVKSEMERLLESEVIDEEHPEVEMKVKLVNMRLGEYQDIVSDSE